MKTIHVSDVRGTAHLVSIIDKNKALGVRFEPGGPELSAGADCQFAMSLLRVAIDGRRRRVTTGIRKAIREEGTWGSVPLLDESRMREVCKLREQGKTYAQIAELVGVSETTAWRALKKVSGTRGKTH